MTTVNSSTENQWPSSRAPDILLNRCVAGKCRSARPHNEEMGRQALRVLAMAHKVSPPGAGGLPAGGAGAGADLRWA